MLYRGIDGLKRAAIRRYSAICFASPPLLTRSPVTTTNAGRRRLAVAIAISKLAVSCTKSLLAVNMPNCGSLNCRKKTGGGASGFGVGVCARIASANHAHSATDSTSTGLRRISLTSWRSYVRFLNIGDVSGGHRDAQGVEHRSQI